MNLRLKCSCGTRFMTSDELRGRMVRCPKCRKTLRVPDGVAAEVRSSDSPSVSFVTEDKEVVAAPALVEAPETWQSHQSPRAEPVRSRSGVWWVVLLFLLLVPGVIVGTLFILPYFQPKDPREVVARRYLDALRRGDIAEANRLSVLVNNHPRNLTGVEQITIGGAQPLVVSGKFSGLRQFHSEIAQKYSYNESRGRFEPKDELGMGLDALAKVEEVKRRSEEKVAENATKKYANPEDKMVDDAIGIYGAFGEIAKQAGGLLSSGTLGPTYDDLLKKTQVPLTDAERALAEHFSRDQAKWQRLLGRSFFDLPDLGDFELYDTQIEATIRTEGQSLGEPGRPVHLRLVRFVMGSIDTGWRVWQAE